MIERKNYLYHCYIQLHLILSDTVSKISASFQQIFLVGLPAYTQIH